MGLLDGKLAKIIGPAMKKAGLDKPATFIKVTPGPRTPGSLSSGTNPTETSYVCRGFVSDYSSDDINGTLVTKEDRKVILFGDKLFGLVSPTDGDKVTIEGTTFRVIRAERDPASATWTLQARKTT